MTLEKLHEVVRGVVDENPSYAAHARLDHRQIGWFVGKVMQVTRGEAHVSVVRRCVHAALGVE